MTEIAGVPSQFFQDALTVILEATPPHFNIEGSHCGGNIVGWAQHEGSGCHPLNPEDSWECQKVGLSALSHRECFKTNLGITARNCSCPQGWVNLQIETYTSIIIPYFSQSDLTGSFCAVCADNHGKNPPCQFCGEVHD